MKNGCSVIAVPLCIMLLLGALLLAVKDDAGPDQAQAANTSSAADCAGVAGSLDRAFPGPGYNNPKPGTFYLPPVVWASATQENRQTVARLLALQVGCAFGTDPINATVEIRSITDNRVLARGPIWNLEEQ